MIDITHKISSLRMAKAGAVVRVGGNGLKAIKNKAVPQGDVLESAKAAALLAIKGTSNALPHAHPIPIDYSHVVFEIHEQEILIIVTVKTIFRTGCEMEALHGATVAALTIYDMLKSLDDQLEIGTVKILEKKGGEAGFRTPDVKHINAGVLVASDSVFDSGKQDVSGKIIVNRMSELKISLGDYEVVPDDENQIRAMIDQFIEKKKINLIVTTGGTGLGMRDVTFEAIEPMLERVVDGISEAGRAFGQQRTPFAMLSRSIAGTYKGALVIALPGSAKAVEEYLEVLFPYVLHVFEVLAGTDHGRKS